MAQSLTDFLSAGSELKSFSAGFFCYGIVINNDTGNWLIVNGTWIVPPWTYGWSQPLPGTKAISITLLPGPSIIPSVGGGTFVTYVLTEDHLSQSNGYTAVNSTSISAGTVTVSGPVTVTGTVAISSGTVSVSGTVTIAGSVTVTSGTVSISGTVAVSGSVTITAGTVNIGTVAGTVTVTGTITNTVNTTVTNSIAVTSVGGTVTVAGTINIGNTPSVTISGTPNVNIASGTVSISGSVTVGTITAGNVNVNPGVFTYAGSGALTLGATGTRMQLSTVSVPTQVVMIEAYADNANTIRIGNSGVTNARPTAGNRSTTAGFELEPGSSFTIPATNLNALYVIGTASDGVSYQYWT